MGPITQTVSIMEIRIELASPEDAEQVRRIMRESFEEYRERLTPPTGSLSESVEDVRRAIEVGGALLAYIDDMPVGTARYKVEDRFLYAERLGVMPEYRRLGIAAALMRSVEERARVLNLPEVRLSVRASLPSNLRFYEQIGYRTIESYPHPRGPDFVITLSKRV